MTRQAGRQDAIENIHTAQHTVDQIFGRADAHQVTRFILRQQRKHDIEHGMHLVLGLAHRKPADGDAGRIESGNKFSGFRSQVGLNAALNDAEQRLVARFLALSIVPPSDACDPWRVWCRRDRWDRNIRRRP